MVRGPGQCRAVLRVVHWGDPGALRRHQPGRLCRTATGCARPLEPLRAAMVSEVTATTTRRAPAHLRACRRLGRRAAPSPTPKARTISRQRLPAPAGEGQARLVGPGPGFRLPAPGFWRGVRHEHEHEIFLRACRSGFENDGSCQFDISGLAGPHPAPNSRPRKPLRWPVNARLAPWAGSPVRGWAALPPRMAGPACCPLAQRL